MTTSTNDPLHRIAIALEAIDERLGKIHKVMLESQRLELEEAERSKALQAVLGGDGGGGMLGMMKEVVTDSKDRLAKLDEETTAIQTKIDQTIKATESVEARTHVLKSHGLCDSCGSEWKGPVMDRKTMTFVLQCSKCGFTRALEQKPS